MFIKHFSLVKICSLRFPTYADISSVIWSPAIGFFLVWPMRYQRTLGNAKNRFSLVKSVWWTLLPPVLDPPVLDFTWANRAHSEHALGQTMHFCNIHPGKPRTWANHTLRQYALWQTVHLGKPCTFATCTWANHAIMQTVHSQVMQTIKSGISIVSASYIYRIYAVVYKMEPSKTRSGPFSRCEWNCSNRSCVTGKVCIFAERIPAYSCLCCWNSIFHHYYISLHCYIRACFYRVCHSYSALSSPSTLFPLHPQPHCF